MSALDRSERRRALIERSAWILEEQIDSFDELERSMARAFEAALESLIDTLASLDKRMEWDLATDGANQR